MSDNNDDNKLFPVDNESNEDDEENKKNAQCKSYSKANDNCKVKKDYNREIEASEYFLHIMKVFYSKINKYINIFVLNKVTWVLWEYNCRIEVCY